MPFDEPRDHGGGEPSGFFFIAKTLQADVVRGETIRTTFNGRKAACVAHEFLPKGTVVNFVFTNDLVGVHYEFEPGERRSMTGRFE